MDAGQTDSNPDAERREPAAESAGAAPLPALHAERSVMHPDRDDLEWRYVFGACSAAVV